jgi:hypothetical protein
LVDLEANITGLPHISYYRAHAAGNAKDNMTFAKMLINLLLDQIHVRIIASLACVVFRGEACLISRISPGIESNLQKSNSREITQDLQKFKIS